MHKNYQKIYFVWFNPIQPNSDTSLYKVSEYSLFILSNSLGSHLQITSDTVLTFCDQFFSNLFLIARGQMRCSSPESKPPRRNKIFCTKYFYTRQTNKQYTCTYITNRYCNCGRYGNPPAKFHSNDRGSEYNYVLKPTGREDR